MTHIESIKKSLIEPSIMDINCLKRLKEEKELIENITNSIIEKTYTFLNNRHIQK